MARIYSLQDIFDGRTVAVLTRVSTRRLARRAALKKAQELGGAFDLIEMNGLKSRNSLGIVSGMERHQALNAVNDIREGVTKIVRGVRRIQTGAAPAQ